MESDFDVLVVFEAFLTDVAVELVQFPSNFFYFLSSGIHGEDVNEGRASGGILILLRSSLFDGPACKVIEKSPAHLALHIQPRNSDPFVIVGVYRAGSERSPVYDAHLLLKVERVCSNANQVGLPVIVAGDFNAKIGSIDGPYGEVEEFLDLLPLASESEEINDAGADMLSLFSSLDYLRLPFSDGGVEKFTFLTPPTEQHPRGGASIIDYVFFSPGLLDSL